MLCQWVQLYGMDPEALRVLLRTYASVFPHRMVFKGSPGDVLVLGSEEPIQLDLERIASRMMPAAVRADLARVRIQEPADLLARFRLADADIEAYVAKDPDGALNTDDNALVEFAAARSLYREDHQANDADLAAVMASVREHLVFPAAGSAFTGSPAMLSAGITAHLIRSGMLPRAALLIDRALQEPASQEERAELLALRGDLMAKKGDSEAASGAWREARALAPAQPRATIGLANRLIASGQPKEAASMLEAIATGTAGRLALGKARFLAGDARGALATLDGFPPECPGLDAETATLRHLYRGRSLAALARWDEAVGELKLYFELYPQVPRPAETSIDAATDLARSYTELKRPDEAVEQYRVIAGLADSLASWNRRQAAQSIERKDLPAAALFLSTALRWNHRDNPSRRQLARALNDLGRHQEALAVWRELDRQLEGDVEALRNIAGLSLEGHNTRDAVAAFQRLREIEDDPELIRRLDEEIARLRQIPVPDAAAARDGLTAGGSP